MEAANCSETFSHKMTSIFITNAAKCQLIPSQTCFVFACTLTNSTPFGVQRYDPNTNCDGHSCESIAW
jgi:hypothetical protein